MTSKRNADIRTVATDFTGRFYEDKAVLLFDLFRAQFEKTGDRVIRGISFVNCQIEGPAVLMPVEGCSMDDVVFGAMDDDMRSVVLHPASPDRTTGAIAMIDCTFHAVDFIAIGFTGSPRFLKTLLDLPA